MIKELRDRTGAGVLACKKALDQAGNDMDAAIKILKEQGLASAVKRAGREALEGAISAASKDNAYGMLFLGSETDFVAKNETFCKFIRETLDKFLASDCKNIEDFSFNGVSINEMLAEMGSKIGENITLRGGFKVSVEPNSFAVTYLHNKLNENFDDVATIGVVAKFEGSCEPALAKQIAMHLASFKPQVLKRSELSKEWIEEQTEEAKKLDEKAENRIKEAVLEEQAFLMDPSLTMKKLFENNNIKMLEFKIFSVK